MATFALQSTLASLVRHTDSRCGAILSFWDPRTATLSSIELIEDQQLLANLTTTSVINGVTNDNASFAQQQYVTRFSREYDAKQQQKQQEEEQEEKQQQKNQQQGKDDFENFSFTDAECGMNALLATATQLLRDHDDEQGKTQADESASPDRLNNHHVADFGQVVQEQEEEGEGDEKGATVTFAKRITSPAPRITLNRKEQQQHQQQHEPSSSVPLPAVFTTASARTAALNATAGRCLAVYGEPCDLLPRAMTLEIQQAVAKSGIALHCTANSSPYLVIPILARTCDVSNLYSAVTSRLLELNSINRHQVVVGMLVLVGKEPVNENDLHAALNPDSPTTALFSSATASPSSATFEALVAKRVAFRAEDETMAELVSRTVLSEILTTREGVMAPEKNMNVFLNSSSNNNSSSSVPKHKPTPATTTKSHHPHSHPPKSRRASAAVPPEKQANQAEQQQGQDEERKQHQQQPLTQEASTSAAELESSFRAAPSFRRSGSISAGSFRLDGTMSKRRLRHAIQSVMLEQERQTVAGGAAAASSSSVLNNNLAVPQPPPPSSSPRNNALSAIQGTSAASASMQLGTAHGSVGPAGNSSLRFSNAAAADDFQRSTRQRRIPQIIRIPDSTIFLTQRGILSQRGGEFSALPDLAEVRRCIEESETVVAALREENMNLVAVQQRGAAAFGGHNNNNNATTATNSAFLQSLLGGNNNNSGGGMREGMEKFELRVAQLRTENTALKHHIETLQHRLDSVLRQKSISKEFPPPVVVHHSSSSSSSSLFAAAFGDVLPARPPNSSRVSTANGGSKRGGAKSDLPPSVLLECKAVEGLDKLKREIASRQQSRRFNG